LATAIALYEPDLIALQEVEDISVVEGISADVMHPGPPFVDYLQSLLNALALRGQKYTVAAVVVNLDLEVPLPFDVTGDSVPDTVQVVDRDVILVREGVAFTRLAGYYYNTTGPGLCGVPIPNPAYESIGPQYFQSTPSVDGCNYTIVAPLSSPLLPSYLNIERGYVGIDATVRGETYRFVTTHLEQRELLPNSPETAIYQSLQAVELVGTLLATTPSDRKLILLGDFNSSHEDAGIDSIIPPYKIITDRINGIPGFTDSWKKNPLALLDPEGLTCCQDPELYNRTSHLYERIDIVFVRNSRFTPWEFVTTRVPIFPLWLAPNWGSDHGGVFARLNFR
jgi:endonuclease/exonuclease/phosphatase family metal-dependent hydrolase